MKINVYSTASKKIMPKFKYSSTKCSSNCNRELNEHLNGLINVIFTSAGCEMTLRLNTIIQHIQKVKYLYVVHIDKALDKDEFFTWLEDINAIAMFPDGSLKTPEGKIIASPHMHGINLNASIPYFSEANMRREKNIQVMRLTDTDYNDTLPPVVCEKEAILRSVNEIFERISALTVVCLYCDSFFSDTPNTSEYLKTQYPFAFEYLTLKEIEFMYASDKAEACGKAIQLIWRVEALQTLLWVIDVIKEMPPADITCNYNLVTAKAETLMKNKNTALDNIHLRNKSSILDSLDLCYRMHWALRNSQNPGVSHVIKATAPVIYERHYTLNWLTRFEEADWDSVSTTT